MDLKEKIVQSFNEKLGSNLDNLEKLFSINEQLELQLTKIEQSLSLASTEAPSKIKNVIKESDELCAKVDSIHGSCETLLQTISSRNNENEKLASIKEAVEKISEMEKALDYLKVIKSVEDTSQGIQTAILMGDEDAMIEMYMDLVDTYVVMKTTGCTYLSNFVQDTMHYWHNHLKAKLSLEYNEIIKSLRWPFCGANLSVTHTQHNSETIVRFRILTQYLLSLQMPPEDTSKVVTSSSLVDFPPVSLPVSLLVRPLKQRFIYHFTGYKQTNRRDKPEWFFTQILTWIKDHSQWINVNMEPVAKKYYGFEQFKIEFMRALVQMAVEKLQTELQVVQYDDSLFAHMIDEALGFEKELRETLFYPANQPATVSVLTQAHIFVKWVNMEKKYATEKMDNILSSETAWEMLTRSDLDEMKVTECADAFLTLLTTITDRYSHLPTPGHKLQFLDLQLELIDDWRVRLLQLLHEDFECPLTSMIPRILNSLYYVSSVLMDWGANVHFLKLHFFKKQMEAVETAAYQDDVAAQDIAALQGTVFDDSVDLLQRLERKLVLEIVESVVLDVKAKSRAYRTDRWFTMQSEKELSSLSLTPSGCAMFQQLSERLHQLQQNLALPLFKQAWQELASRLDQYLLEEVVLINKFNTGGAAQLQFDIVRNLFPLFGLYTNKPESYFPLMREACILLNLSLGSVILILESMESKSSLCKETLTEIGIFKLSPETVSLVLKTRMDISTR